MKNEQAAKWAKNNPEKTKKHQRDFYYRHKQRMQLKRTKRGLSQYGLSLKDYDNMLEAQDFRCKICGSTNPNGNENTMSKKTRFSVDHCHTTGKVRGLLCTKCNSGIGMFNDNISLLTAAISYLKETQNGNN